MRPLELHNTHNSLWNDRCDYIELESCSNMNKNNMNLIVLQLNIRSLISHQQDLCAMLGNLRNKNSTVDIILLHETFLNSHTEKLAYQAMI